MEAGVLASKIQWPCLCRRHQPWIRLAADARQFWSFQKPVPTAAPVVAGPWAANDIDKFVLAKLQEKGLKPVADAGKRTLIRRATYDLTGLPPTPAEIDAFLANQSPTAYDQLLERLLASRAYGERWGRKWLDLVRYADTAGGDGDFPIPQAIKYRDYVLQSFLEDKPFNRFILEQIAGDLLPHQSEKSGGRIPSPPVTSPARSAWRRKTATSPTPSTISAIRSWV